MIEPARSFDLAAEEYEATRPSYPDELLDLLPVASDATVLDLGAGTGKLTRVLARRYARVIAVEPLDGMRGILERVVPNVDAVPGSAEAIPLGDGSLDAVFAAQAFHWFDHDRAIPEIARVLRPGGVLALVWNGPDESRPTPLPADYVAYLGELRRERSTLDEQPSWRDLVARGPFGGTEKAAVAHDHVLDRQGLLDNARSVSWIASRPPDEKNDVLARLAELLPDGTYAIPNLANLLWATRS
jgi:SAM-dependent methyltransferase